MQTIQPLRNLNIHLQDVGEGQVQGRLFNGWTLMAETALQTSDRDALRLMGELLRTMSTDIITAAEQNNKLDRDHPKIRRLLGWDTSPNPP
jgi:hypothetical protein